jgi:HAD superfamily hydrolase (TIGR01549 family)
MRSGILKEVKAIFFDFDNTLVDSASIIGEVHRKTAEAIAHHLNSLGHAVSVDEIAALIKSVEERMEASLILDRDLYWPHVVEMLGASKIPAEIIAHWTEIYWLHYSRASVFADTIPTLTELSRRYRLGMVANTDGKPGLKRRRVEGSGLAGFFEVIIVAGDDVPEVKPDPRPFRAAADALGVRPEESVMVGDHPRNDVEGAKKAGMKAVLVGRGEPNTPPHGVKPDLVITTLSDLLLIV